MISLASRLPRLAEQEVLIFEIGEGAPVPAGTYAFLEHYCDDPECDCRRVLITVLSMADRQVKATLTLGFDPEEQASAPALEPLASQPEHAEALLGIFVGVLDDNPVYLERLQHHYVLFKEKVLGKRYRGKPFPKPGNWKVVVRGGPEESRPRESASDALPDAKPGRNVPCPCGSGKKYKNCCGAAGPRPRPQRVGSRGDPEDMVQRLAKRLRSGSRPLRDIPWDDFAVDAVPGLGLAILELAAQHAPSDPSQNPVPEYKACLLLLERTLTELRFQAERGRDWGQKELDDVQRRMAEEVFQPGVQAAVRSDFLEILSGAGVDPHPSLVEAQRRLAEHSAEFVSRPGPLDLAPLLEEFRADGGDNPFDLFDMLLPHLRMMTPEEQVAGAAYFATSEHELLREMAVLMLLHPDGRVRSGIPEVLAGVASSAVSPVGLRRLLTVRNWLPREQRPGLDEAIRVARRAGVDCAPSPRPTGAEWAASSFDGSGAQAVLFSVRRQRRRAAGGFLFKQGVGVRDQWCEVGVTKARFRAIRQRLAATLCTLTVDRGYIDLVVSHFLAEGLAKDASPPAGFLRAAELAGGFDWMPSRLSFADEIDRLAEEAGPAVTGSEIVQQVLDRSEAWPGTASFAQSWFEDDALVDETLQQALGAPGNWYRERDRAADVVVRRVVEPRRAVWCERLLWLALWAKASPDPSAPPWQSFLVLARELLSSRPAEGIPLLRGIGRLTVHSALARAAPA